MSALATVYRQRLKQGFEEEYVLDARTLPHMDLCKDDREAWDLFGTITTLSFAEERLHRYGNFYNTVLDWLLDGP